jgi:DNA adenine methylase
VNYQGGKERIARRLTTALLRHSRSREVYFEPFLGAGSTAVLAGSFRAAVLTDAHPDLVLLWRALLFEGWEPPEELTEEHYQALRKAEPSPLRAFAGFGCSFGGKWFGGFARSGFRAYPAEAARALKRKARAMRICQVLDVFQADYRALAPGSGAVVYCDPPYEGTESYAAGNFSSAEFWETAEQWARQGAEVFVSEYVAPIGWAPVWSGVVRLQLAGGAGELRQESLYTYERTRSPAP